jgi:hypothetical protein
MSGGFGVGGGGAGLGGAGFGLRSCDSEPESVELSGADGLAGVAVDTP